MRQLNYILKGICNRNRDGSYATQKDRQRTLQLVANELHQLGYKHIQHPNNLKARHIFAFVNKWQNSEKPLNPGTIKNRMANLRWLGEKTGNSGFIRSSNGVYGIPDRSFVGSNKAVEFTDTQIAAISDSRARYSALLQKHFGLRRAEGIKFVVKYADRGNYIRLKGSWCKGGRERDVPLVNDDQRRLLNEIKAAVGSSSLIPGHMKYVAQLRVFEKEMKCVGLGRSHGARHMYAQNRYERLTMELQCQRGRNVESGFVAPAIGGLKPAEMCTEDREIDREARQIISRELGHERLQIVSLYLGG